MTETGFCHDGVHASRGRFDGRRAAGRGDECGRPRDGSFVTLPALVANASSTVALFPGSVTTA